VFEFLVFELMRVVPVELVEPVEVFELVELADDVPFAN